MDDLKFNPADKKNSRRICQLVCAFPDTRYFRAGQSYPLKGYEEEYGLIPRYSIAKASKVTTEIDFSPAESSKYFVIDNRIMGRGEFGQVRRIKGRWRVFSDHAEYKEKPTKLYKSCKISQDGKEGVDSNYGINLSDVIHENHMLSRLPYFRIKYDLIPEEGAYGILMAKIGFTNLKQWSRQWRRKNNQMSTNQALALAIDVIDCVKTLHNQYRLIHKDIKPENICLQLVRGQLKPKLIDLGFACHRDHNNHLIVGTRGFLDPTNFMEISHQVDEVSDEYSTAITIMTLFGFKTSTIDLGADDSDKQMKSYPTLKYNLLFEQQNDLQEEDKSILREALVEATRFDRKKRKPLSYLREKLQLVLIKRLNKVEVSDFELHLSQFYLQHRLSILDSMEKMFVDDLYRDYEALTALDTLLACDKVNLFLPMPVQDIIQDYIANQHTCTDIYLYVADEIQKNIMTLLRTLDIPTGLLEYSQKTEISAQKTMAINANHLIRLCRKGQFIYDASSKPDNPSAHVTPASGTVVQYSLFQEVQPEKRLPLTQAINADKMDKPTINPL